MSAIAAGSVLHDRYRVDELVSVGGMGAVYAGTHLLLHKRVAIKVLRSDLPGGNLAFDRFHREAIAASQIGHENIVQVTDMGIVPDGTAYLVMELLEGKSLGTAIREEAPFDVARACRIARDILGGVGAAHGAGIVHRDLKPDNIFLARRGGREVIKVVDFGVSLLKRQDVPHTRLTSTGTVVGTPRYMSPEQARGEQDLTEAVDIYAITVVLYEMLTAELPYDGSNYNVVIHSIMSGELIPIKQRRADLPAGLCDVIQRGLALAPADRFPDAEAMALALEPWCSEPTSAPRSPSLSAPAARAEQLAEALAATVASVPATAAPSVAAAAQPSARRFVPTREVTADPAWTAAKGGESTVSYRGMPATRGGRGLLVVVLLLLVAAGAAAAAYAMWFRGDDGASLGSPTSPERPAQAPPRKDEQMIGPPAPEMVTIKFQVVPPTATVFAYDAPVSDEGLVLPRGPDPVEVRVEAPDHTPQVRKVIPDQDKTVNVELLPSAGRGPTRPKLPEADPNEPDPNEPPPDPPVTETESDAGADIE